MKTDRLNAIAAAQIALWVDLREFHHPDVARIPRYRGHIARMAQITRRELADLGGLPA